MFKHSSFDFVFMDIEMPIMDGYEATRQIRRWEQEKKLKATPIVALTAHAFVRFRKKCMAAGCAGYLTKPVQRETLIHSIATHLQMDKNDSTDGNEDIPVQKRLSNKVPEVCLDPKIKTLLPRFLKNKRKEAEKLFKTLQSDDMDELQSQSHTIKGTCWMHGFKELGDMCLDLERAARDTDRSKAYQHATQITDYLNNVQISYAEEKSITE